ALLTPARVPHPELSLLRGPGLPVTAVNHAAVGNVGLYRAGNPERCPPRLRARPPDVSNGRNPEGSPWHLLLSDDACLDAWSGPPGEAPRGFGRRQAGAQAAPVRGRRTSHAPSDTASSRAAVHGRRRARDLRVGAHPRGRAPVAEAVPGHVVPRGRPAAQA